jgi:hypothetical protein
VDPAREPGTHYQGRLHCCTVSSNKKAQPALAVLQKKRRKIFARTRSVDGRKKKKETTKGKSVFEKKSCARLRAISMVYNLNMQDMVQTPIRLTVHARAFGNFTGVLGFSSSRKWRRKNFNGKPQTLELHANDFNAKYFSFCLEKKNQKTSSSSAYFVAISSV